MNHVYLFQPQYQVDYREEKNYWIPYSVGCIWAYCTQFDDIKESFHLADIIFRREDHDTLLQRLVDPSVCGFSCYQWNRNYCLNLARRIKEIWPRCVIVFGGPEVAIDFQFENYIDSLVFGEGEEAWVDILRCIANDEPCQKIYKKNRLDIKNFPSPYSQGIFDSIIKNNPDVKWATTLETNRGCPFSCTFCDWGSVTYSKIKKFDIERVAEDIDWISNNPISYIFCADANFGILKERDLEISQLISQAGQKNKNLEIFNATFNKNNNEWSFKILQELGALNKGFTVSVQSLNPLTLKSVKRDNLGINDLQNIFRLSNDYNVNAYTELILGLPFETKETFIDGLTNLLELGQHNQIDVWFTDLLVNSELATGMSRLNHGIQTIKTKNYLALLNQDDDSKFDEEIELVCATNTMSTSDMVDSYMYAWMIVNIHLQGYSQIVSKYCRYRYNVSFKDFYNNLLESIKIQKDIKPLYDRVRSIVTSLLTTGILPPGISAHNLVFLEGEMLYKNKDIVFQMVNDLFDKLGNDQHDSIKQLQKYFIFDHKIDYPIELNCDFDVNSLKCSLTRYRILPKANQGDLKDFYESYYAMRRKGLIKNVLEKKL